MARSAYIHIPFCSHKCDFCDFAAFAGLDHLEDEYANILCDEIERKLKADPPQQGLKSIFYGGGTPGLIKAETLARIQQTAVRLAKLAADAEVSLETTPHAITADKVHRWLDCGLNRISIGIESFQDSELKAIGRDHTREQALEGVTTACDEGFTNVSCDFMYSLPTQTIESWRTTLDDFLQLARQFPQIKHVSAYGLHIAINAPLLTRFPKNSPHYPTDESFEGMYEMLVAKLESAGFIQYEVSNFARPGFESIHNLAYWLNAEYYGFGVSAHRYIGGVRSSNWRSLARYMRDSDGCETHEQIDAATRLQEAIMLGLRMRAGIDLDAFAAEHGVDLMQSARKPIEKFVDGGFLEIQQGRLRITSRGVPVSNGIIAELI